MIEDGAFIGSDTQLIAPVTVGKGAYVGSRLDDSRGRAGRRARHRAGKQRNIDGLGRQEEDIDDSGFEAPRIEKADALD